MYRHHQKNRAVRYALCTAIAASLVAGCAGSSPFASRASSAVERSSVKEVSKTLAQAERAVEQAPRDAVAREALAQAYLASGRFESAAATFEDVKALGSDSARTALSRALAYIGAGNNGAAVATLDQWQDSIPATDLGLALALAGDTSRGVTILSQALRSGVDSPKLRQNLAYAYALDGRWREARIMAAQDVPADQLDHRISEWATQGRPEDYRRRVAGMIGAPVTVDAGQPTHLALAPGNGPALAAADELPAPLPLQAEVSEPRTEGELPPIDDGASFWTAPVATAEPAPVQKAEFASAFAEPVSSTTFAAKPVVQPISRSTDKQQRAPAKGDAQASGATAREEEWTHLVQLGSFSSEARARRAWEIFVTRNPALAGREMVITQAVVRGKNYWRVSAGGFDRRSAHSLCMTVKGRGGGCIAYSAARPLPGAIPARGQTAPRMAQR